MTRHAVTVGAPHVCPSVTAGVPHVKGPILSGEPTVLIEGEPAARMADLAACQIASPVHDFVVEGQVDVLVGGRPMVRRWDRTAHGGIVVMGKASVVVGAAGFDPVAAAINRIAATPYGASPEGQKMIARLRALHRDGKIRFAGGEGNVDGQTDRATSLIEVRNGLQDDVDHVAAVLVHEGAHVEQNERVARGEQITDLAREREAWDRELAFYEQQRAQGSASHDSYLEGYGRARNKDEYLRGMGYGNHQGPQ